MLNLIQKSFGCFSRRALALLAALLAGAASGTAGAAEMPFGSDWRFVRGDEPQGMSGAFDDRGWETVTLPHTARVEALVAGQTARQWQGICWYRKTFSLPADAADKTILLRFDGAMNAAEIWVNSQHAGTFMGGYLPYVMDISALARPGTNLVAVRLDNRDNPVTGPKPLADLDFNLYSGLYRQAHLIVKDRLHITDPILADKVAGGGVFVTFPDVSPEKATVNVRTQVRNAGSAPRSFVLQTTLLDGQGKTVTRLESGLQTLAAGADQEMVQALRVSNPSLWSPDSPSLYQLRSELVEQGRTVDAERTRIGIRRIEMTPDGFRINGRKMFLRGANRHQEYPYIGNALSDAAQYRDARKIKEAGFDYIRLSHYPQSPAFLDACDELGLVVMNCLMGWQYFNKGNPAFAALKLQECRQLVRRDRNHPCVILWEVSLNESDMPKTFVQQSHAAAHEEYPGDQCFTCGWTDGYDVFIQARQHGGCKKAAGRPCVISEYGDWEYYAQNAGFEQHLWKDLQPAERNSRQLRGDGEIRLLQQALNFQEAHNDNLGTPAFGDSLWVMFDYNRGYAPEIEASGVMDIFRLPKPACGFFRSQRSAGERVAGKAQGPMVFIASRWTPESPLAVRVFGNCEETALYLNGRLIGRRPPDATRVDKNLKHPPVTFQLDRFEPGTLRAVGYVGGREAAHHECRTPGEAAELALRFDLADQPFAATGKDTVFCYASLRDASGTEVPSVGVPVFFGATTPARLVGHNPILSEAGTATILLESDTAQPRCTVYALCLVREQDQTRILSAAASPDGTPVPRYEICYTTDGSAPSARSPVYSKPVKNAAQLRAVIVAEGRTVASANLLATAPSTSGKPDAFAAAAQP